MASPQDSKPTSSDSDVPTTLRNTIIDTTTDTVAADVPCQHCGYNLRTLSVTGVCPECGSPVTSSLRSDQLAISDPMWRRRILGGVTRLLIAGIGMPIVALLVLLATFLPRAWVGEDVAAVGFAIEGGLAFILTAGVFAVTALDETCSQRSEKTWPSHLARLTATLAFLSGTIGVTCCLLPRGAALPLQMALPISIPLAIIAMLTTATHIRHIIERSTLDSLRTSIKQWRRWATASSAVGTLLVPVTIICSPLSYPEVALVFFTFAGACIIGLILWITALPGLFLLRRTLKEMQT